MPGTKSYFPFGTDIRRTAMSNSQKLVWSIFADRGTAETAVDEMKSWDKASKDIKLGAIGGVYKNKKGNLHKCQLKPI
jgi:hypothetical protein